MATLKVTYIKAPLPMVCNNISECMYVNEMTMLVYMLTIWRKIQIAHVPFKYV